MPVTKLFVEGELDEELLATILAGSPVVERRGGKYGLQGAVLRERESTGMAGLHFLRDRDFDFEPVFGRSPTPVPIRTERAQLLVGWHWFRHSIECYLLEPMLMSRALARPKEDFDALILQAAAELGNYQAARWTIGQVRTKLPPSRHLETFPPSCAEELRLPTDCSEQASWSWLSNSTQTFITPLAAAFAEGALRESFDRYRTTFSSFSVADILIWYSGKDLLAFIAPRLGGDSPKVLRNRLRNWIRNNPDETLLLLPEWRELKQLTIQ